MKKKKGKRGLWTAEVEQKGWPKFLKEQIENHRTLRINELIRFTGCCRNTVVKHVRRFVDENPDVQWKNRPCLDTAMITLSA